MAVMIAKRSLKLGSVKKHNPAEAGPLDNKDLNYSPTTGTRQISPFSSPTSSNAEDLGNSLSHGNESDSESRLSRRGQPQTVEDAFAALQSNVQSSLVRILKAREKLTSLQALEGSRELENIIGDSDSSCDLSAEVQKTQALMIQAEELQLLKRNHGQRPARGVAALQETRSGLTGWVLIPPQLRSPITANCRD
ncbi:centromere protein R isoform X2 [Coturnix japonica]|uniref:centromere protein R isoform X2 n=1 Tax=Coturnix japonica TaxID=93934 RepID=UPI0013A5C109|nr:centromere protein R isoform X2 [Coturnix japonica]